MIPDQGALNETSPAKLMLALHEQSQTGILYFRQNDILKVFYLNQGKISWAISSDEEDKIDHVLLANKLVTPEVLAPYQAGGKIAESFGRILVENGVITLEVLIQASREQVCRIAASVLRWNNGNYQLVKEPPPTRLVSLDVAIPALVANYVLTRMDINIIWEELGSISGELQHNNDPVKKRLYTLNTEQQGIFSHFRQPKRLETVLLDFPAEGKYRILKIIYYLLLTGLLDRKEAERASHIDFKELDGLFEQTPGNRPIEVAAPPTIDDTAIRDIPVADLPGNTAAKEAFRKAEPAPLPDLMPPESIEQQGGPRIASPEKKREKEWPQLQSFAAPEKRKPRWLGALIVSLPLLAALAGLFLWLNRSVAAPRQAETKTAGSMKKAEAKVVSTAAPQAQQEDLPETAAAAEPSPAPAAAVMPAATEPQGVATAETEPARKLFAAGDFEAAGESWRNEIISQRVRFSILLEFDCLKESVRDAYGQVTDKEKFFLLNKNNRNGQNCWLVLWGRYDTADEAAQAMKFVPEYFLRQSDPPVVVELEPYL